MPTGVAPLAADLQEHVGRSRDAVEVLRELSLWLRSDEGEKAWAVAADVAGFPGLAGKGRSPPKIDSSSKWVSTCVMVRTWLSPGALAVAGRLRQGGSNRPPPPVPNAEEVAVLEELLPVLEIFGAAVDDLQSRGAEAGLVLSVVAALDAELGKDSPMERAARWRLNLLMERHVRQQAVWEPAQNLPTPWRNLGRTTRVSPSCWEVLACAALLHPACRGGTWLGDAEEESLRERLVYFCRSFFPGGSVGDRPAGDEHGAETQGSGALPKGRRKKPTAEVVAPAAPGQKRKRRRGDWDVRLV